MKTLAAFLLFAVTLAHDTILPGSLYISQIDGGPDDQDLRFENGKLVSGEMMTFDFDDKGTLFASEIAQYLRVDHEGYLVGDDQAHAGFSLRSQHGSGLKRRLQYNGEEEFQLCGDKSVAYKSSCAGAQKIEITYEDHFQPR